MYKIYIIQEGDSLEKIAEKFGTSPDVIEKINNNITNAKVGSQIIVPNNEKVPFIIYEVKQGDNIYEIAKKYEIDYNDILLINGIKTGDYIYPNQELLLPKNNIGIYFVKKGDTLSTISSNLNINQKKIIDYNASIYLLPEQILLYKKEKR